jgi:hypothetical protein
MATRAGQVGSNITEQNALIQKIITQNKDANTKNNIRLIPTEAYVGTSQKINLMIPWRVADHFAYTAHVANGIELYKPSKEEAPKRTSKYTSIAKISKKGSIAGNLYLLQTRDDSITKKIGTKTRIVRWLHMRFPSIMDGACVHHFIQEGMKSPPPVYKPYRGKDNVTASQKTELAKLGTKK